MLEFKTEYRVPYGQVDRMGFLYHSHYLELFDLGRTELMRNIGLPNLKIEEMGYQFPVCKAEVNYRRPAQYDDILEIRTRMQKLPLVAVVFEYEIFRHVSSDSPVLEDTPITTGKVKLAFMKASTKRAVCPPEFIMNVLRPYFQ